MMLRVALRAVWLASLFIAGAAQAGERDQLNACKAMVAQSKTGVAQDDPALQKCRQIIKEWTLRDSRRSVDEDGRPLR
jgi:hypothetical protein